MNIDHSSVNIRQDILQKICGIAEKQHLTKPNDLLIRF